jgi:hypothetical protein
MKRDGLLPDPVVVVVVKVVVIMVMVVAAAVAVMAVADFTQTCYFKIIFESKLFHFTAKTRIFQNPRGCVM